MAIYLTCVAFPYRSISLPTPDTHLEGQLSPRHIRRHRTDYDQWTGDPERNSPSVLQRVNCFRIQHCFGLAFFSISIPTWTWFSSFEPRGSRSSLPAVFYCRFLSFFQHVGLFLWGSHTTLLLIAVSLYTPMLLLCMRFHVLSVFVDASPLVWVDGLGRLFKSVVFSFRHLWL